MPEPDGLLAEIAADLRPLTVGLGVEVAIVVPLRAGVRAEPVIIAVGTPGRVALSVAAVLRPVVVSGATALVLAHNHPMRHAVSTADRAFTRRLVAASAVLGVAVRGHVVLLPEGWVDCLQPVNYRGPAEPLVEQSRISPERPRRYSRNLQP